MVGNSGQLASPLYPRNYPHNAEHTWSIIVDQGKKVKIQFVEFDIETGSTCQYDYLQVRTLLLVHTANIISSGLLTCGWKI